MKRILIIAGLLINVFLFSLGNRNYFSANQIGQPNMLESKYISPTIPVKWFYEETFYQKLKVKENIFLNVFNRKGNIKIEGWDKNYLEIIAVKKCTENSEKLKHTFITISGENGLTIRTTSYGNNECAEVSYTIKVPKNVFIGQINTENGKVQIDNIDSFKYSKR